MERLLVLGQPGAALVIGGLDAVQQRLLVVDLALHLGELAVQFGQVGVELAHAPQADQPTHPAELPDLPVELLLIVHQQRLLAAGALPVGQHLRHQVDVGIRLLAEQHGQSLLAAPVQLGVVLPLGVLQDLASGLHAGKLLVGQTAPRVDDLPAGRLAQRAGAQGAALLVELVDQPRCGPLDLVFEVLAVAVTDLLTRGDEVDRVVGGTVDHDRAWRRGLLLVDDGCLRGHRWPPVPGCWCWPGAERDDLLATAASRSCPANTRRSDDLVALQGRRGADRWAARRPCAGHGISAERARRSAPLPRVDRTRRPPHPLTLLAVQVEDGLGRLLPRLGVLIRAPLLGRARVGADLEHLDRTERRFDAEQRQREVLVAVALAVAPGHDRGPRTISHSGGTPALALEDAGGVTAATAPGRRCAARAGAANLAARRSRRTPTAPPPGRADWSAAGSAE